MAENLSRSDDANKREIGEPEYFQGASFWPIQNAIYLWVIICADFQQKENGSEQKCKHAQSLYKSNFLSNRWLTLIISIIPIEVLSKISSKQFAF